MAKKKNNERFKFVGKGAKDYNNDISLDIVEDTCKDVGVKLVAVKDNFSGNMENVIVKKTAKPDKEGRFKEKDIIGRFGEASRCNTFLNGMSAGIRLNKKNK